MKVRVLAGLVFWLSGSVWAYDLDQACYFHDVDQVKRLVETEGADVNAEGPGGWTPLLTSAQGGYLDLVEYLVLHGADVNHSSAEGLDALMVAAGSWTDAPDLVTYLLDQGVDPNLQDKRGRTALIYSLAQRPHPEVAKVLVSHRADVNLRDTVKQWTALNYAVDAGNPDLVKLLVDAGADVSPPSSLVSPFAVAKAKFLSTRLERYREIAQYLNERGARDAEALGPWALDPDHPTGLDLVYAIRDDNRTQMDALLKAGVDPNQVPEFPADVLPLANGGGFLHLVLNALDSSVPNSDVTEMVELLLDAGADPGATDALGRTPLFGAVLRGNADAFALLLVKGADPNAVDAEGGTCVMSLGTARADTEAALNILDWFVRFGGNVNARGAQDQTVLMQLVDRPQNLDLVKFLVEHGADVNLGDDQGTTALRRARDRGLKPMADVIKAAGGVLVAFDYPDDNGSTAAQAILNADLGAIDEVHAADLTRLVARSDRGVPETLLHLAASTGNLQILDTLAPRVADWDARDAYQQTPLLTAVRAGRAEVVAWLVAHEADPNLADAGGVSSFEAAVGNRKVLQALLAGGRKPQGSRAFEAACRTGALGSAQDLLPLLEGAPDPQLVRDCADLGQDDSVTFLLPKVNLGTEEGPLVEKARANRQRFEAYGAPKKPVASPRAPVGLADQRGYAPFVLDQYAPGSDPAAMDPSSVTAGLYVPSGYNPSQPAGLVVSLSGARLGEAEHAVFDAANLLWAGFSADAVDYDETGRRRNHDVYAQSLVWALGRAFNVDPARVYLVGTGWGGRVASQILYRAPQVFRGALAASGVQPALWDVSRGQYADSFLFAQRRTTLVCATGDVDPGRQDVFAQWARLQSLGFARTVLLLEPRGDRGTLSAELLRRGLAVLDATGKG